MAKRVMADQEERRPYQRRAVEHGPIQRKRAGRIHSEFQKDVLAFKTDAQIRSIAQARAAMFRLGENVDALTLMLKARLDFLKTGQHPRPMP